MKSPQKASVIASLSGSVINVYVEYCAEKSTISEDSVAVSPSGQSPPKATAMKFAQLVIGPAGCGKVRGVEDLYLPAVEKCRTDVHLRAHVFSVPIASRRCSSHARITVDILRDHEDALRHNRSPRARRQSRYSNL